MYWPLYRLFSYQSAWNFGSMPKIIFQTTFVSTFFHFEEALMSLRPPGGRGEGRGVKNYGRAWSKLKQILAISRSWTTAPPPPYNIVIIWACPPPCNTAIILPYPHTPYHFDVYPYVTFWHNPSPQNINLYHLKKKPDFFLVYENDIPGVIPQDSWYIVIIFWNTPMLHVLLYSFGLTPLFPYVIL